LSDAVREAETARAPGRLARGIGWCIAATAIVLLALWILRFVFARLRTRADAWTKARLARIPNESARHMALAFMASGTRVRPRVRLDRGARGASKNGCGSASRSSHGRNRGPVR
jgi:hypothetical protein